MRVREMKRQALLLAVVGLMGCKKMAGEACSETSECDPALELRCVKIQSGKSVCRQPGQHGDPCAVKADCQTGFECRKVGGNGICEDLKNPLTWIARLKVPEHMAKAVAELKQMMDPRAIPALSEYYRKNKSLELLKTIIQMVKRSPNDREGVQALISFLDAAEAEHEHASLAVKALAAIEAHEAVPALCKVLEHPLEVKSPANLVKLEAVKALGRLKHERTVPCLIAVLERYPDQNFSLNKQAALVLGTLGDQRAVPALIRGLLMTSTTHGSSYLQAKAALLQIGKPAVAFLRNALSGEDAQLNKLALELKIEEKAVAHRITGVLEDLKEGGIEEATPPSGSGRRGR